MALSPCRERESFSYRSRSSSVSTPTRRNFYYNEIFTIGENALVRSFSCGQVFSKNKNGETFQSTQVRISNYVSPMKSLERMECKNDDCFSSQPNALPIKRHKRKKPVKAKLALKFPEREKCDEDKGRNDSWKLFQFFWKNVKLTVYLNFIVFTIISANFLYKYHHCSQLWNTEELFTKMEKLVIGQEKAVNRIKHILDEFNNSERNSVVVFSGSVGVGKTFVSSMIYDHFPWVSNEYIQFFSSETENKLTSKTYSSCGSNLIIIDGIKMANGESALKAVKNVMNISQNEKFLFILIIHNLSAEDEAEMLNLIKKFEFHHVMFNKLSENDVRNCFDVELRRQKKYISEEKLSKLIDEQMKYCNISKSVPGCKNVFHEVSQIAA